MEHPLSVPVVDVQVDDETTSFPPYDKRQRDHRLVERWRHHTSVDFSCQVEILSSARQVAARPEVGPVLASSRM